MGFLAEHQLEVTIKQETSPTYHHFMGNSTSRLELFVEGKTHPHITNVETDVRHILNTSAHDEVTATINSTKATSHSD